MTAYEVGALIILVFSPWILTTTWMAGGMVRDWFWFKFGIDLLRTR